MRRTILPTLTCAVLLGACIRGFASKEQIVGNTTSTSTSESATSSTGPAPGTCADGVKNQDETDVDCGGVCSPCALGKGCSTDADCKGTAGAGGGGASIHCTNSACTPPLKTYWNERTTGTTPGPHVYASMAYDAVNHVSLLFGGQDSTKLYTQVLWAWDGTGWSPVPVVGSSVALNSPAFVADTARQRFVVFGGTDNVTGSAKTYDWDGQAFDDVSSTGPSGRWATAYAYDSVKGEVVVFGGAGSAKPFNETWVLPDGGKWKPATPSTIPPGRYGAAAAFDAARGRVVVVGGADEIGVIPSPKSTYTWDGTDWTKVDDPASDTCGVRVNAAITYDTRRGRVVVYSGFSGGTDTCEWDGASWSKMDPSGVPRDGERNAPVMAFDSTQGRVFMTGGSTSAGVEQDTWEYYALGNTCKRDDECDLGHCVDGICCAKAKCGTCEACNVDASHAGSCAPVPMGEKDPDTCATTCNGKGVCMQ